MISRALLLTQLVAQTSESLPEHALREATRLFNKYDSRSRSRLAERDNQYNIMEAEDSGDKLTAGISQDGTDYSYFVQVQVGSGGQDMWMLVDTGAGSTWLMGSDCDTDACDLHNTFGPEDSNTLKEDGGDFKIAYGSGTVKGQLATDTINVAGMSFEYTFGLASDTSDDFSNYPFDGILGLSMTKGANDNFLDSMDEAGEVDSNIFCVALNRADDGTNTGEIRFGSTDEDKYTGDITYTTIGAKNDDWAIEIDDMAYDGKKSGAGGKLAYIDTGTSFIFGPQDAVQKIHSVIPGSKSSDGKTYSVPCDSEQALTFTFSGADFEVSPKDWISPKNLQGQCTSNIYGQEAVAGAWLLGDTFLKNVYTVFDKDKKRIGKSPQQILYFTSCLHIPGFASLVQSESDSSVSSTATSSQTTSGSSSSATDSFTTGTASSSETTQTSGPSMGLNGQETKGTDTASAETAKNTDDSDSSARGVVASAGYASLACAGALLALLA